MVAGINSMVGVDLYMYEFNSVLNNTHVNLYYMFLKRPRCIMQIPISHYLIINLNVSLRAYTPPKLT